MLKHWIILTLLLLLSRAGAVEPYSASFKPSIEEDWRWTELEAFGDFQFQHAVEDDQGALWLAGSMGLARYDGEKLERVELEEEGNLVGLLRSKREGIYLLSRRTIYNLRDGRWEIVLRKTERRSDFYEMCETADGAIWIGVWGGLLRLFDGDAKFYQTGSFWANSIVEDRNGMLWLGSGEPEEILVYDPQDRGDGSLRLVHRFDIPSPNKVSRLYMDPEGRVWNVVPDAQGRCYYYENYEPRLGAEGLIGPFNDALSLRWNDGFSMAITDSGRKWFVVRRGLAEVENGKATLVKDENRLPTGKPSLFALSNERLLLGGHESQTYMIDLSLDRWATYRGLNFQCEDQEGVAWFLEHDGRAVSRSIDEQDWLAYGVDDGLIDQPNRIFCSSDGTLWASGRHGDSAALSYRLKGKWKQEVFDESGSIFSHLAVAELSDGSVVFGVGTSVDVLNGRSGGAVSARRINGDAWGFLSLSAPIYPERPAVIVERDAQEVWIGSVGLSRHLGNESEEVKLWEANRWIDDIVVDSRRHVWVAAWGKGVFRFDGEDWRAHNKSKGLASNQVIALLASSDSDAVWAIAVGGMSRYDGNAWSNWKLPFSDSFSRESVTLREGRGGSLWINQSYRSWLLESRTDEALRDGFASRRYQGTRFAPETAVSEFQTRLPEGSPVVALWTGRDRWSETPANSLEFSWRIGGGAWSDFSRDRSAVISGLGSGTSVFEVRARDADWNVDTTPARVEIIVIPPLWKQGWFIAIVAVTLALIALLVERLFKARMRAAIAVEEFKLDFFTNISHELRNPLSVILGPLESLLDEEEALKKRRKLTLVLRNAKKMRRLVDQLLQFRRMELDKSPLHPAPGEIVDFIKETIELQMPLIQEKQLTVNIESKADRFVCAFDPEKLEKIVDNLVSNAIKYSDEGSVVYIRLDMPETERFRELVLVVEDRGKGIPEKDFARVATPFFRVKAHRDSHEGFGLGLALVNGLVKVWGGTIGIESPVFEGHGTRVTVRLPLEETHAAEAGADAEDEEAAPIPSVASDGQRTLLLVEDNADLRAFMKEEFSEEFAVLEASNGREGFDTAMESEPDLIVTDVMMPEMDGFELCRKLRSEPATSHVPIVMLTAKSSDEHSVVGIEAGADVYFAKPVNFLKLRAQIHHLLEMRRKMRLLFSEQLVVEPTEMAIVPADQEILKRAISFVESNMSDPDFGVEHFAAKMGMGKTALTKKLTALVGEAPGSFIRSMRMKRAAQLLSHGQLSVSETIEYVGIRELAYFSKVFKREFGVTPSAYSKGDRGAES